MQDVVIQSLLQKKQSRIFYDYVASTRIHLIYVFDKESIDNMKGH